jgi:hypothetical protein
MNALLGILLLVSGAAASAFWWDTRTNIGSTRTDLRKLRIRRDALIPAPDDPRQPHAFAFREYRQSVPALRDDYRRGAERYRRQHNWFQITVIVGSILTSVSTTAAADQAVWRWAAVVLSATVSISAGVISYFKFRERSMNLQQTADSIDLEIQAFALGIRRYKNIPAEQAAAEFAEEIERIKEEQRKKELQLEQPPEGQRGPSNGQGGASGA